MWNFTENSMPENDRAVTWVEPGGKEVEGTYKNGLWFLLDGTYIYFTPKMWKYPKVYCRWY